MEILRVYLFIKKKWFKKKRNEEKENLFYFANNVLQYHNRIIYNRNLRRFIEFLHSRKK